MHCTYPHAELCLKWCLHCYMSPQLRLLQMPPEELEKIRHLEKHIRKNKLKARRHPSRLRAVSSSH